MLINAICYRTINGEEYLAYCSYKSNQEDIEDVARYNKEKPEIINYCKYDWTKIKEFFINRQEEFF
jgi:hypothetical protein